MALSRRSLDVASCLLLCIISVSIYMPLLVANTSYLYGEDDAHHFNRTIEMAQRREINPHYFNKPALHFYLRLPVVYAAVAVERQAGRIGSIKDIRTRDPYGLAGFATSPSHPRIVAWTRGVSVAWTCLLALLSFLILRGFAQPRVSGWIATLMVIASPEVVRNSYIVGVDTLMALCCLATSAYALHTLRNFSPKRLLVCSLLAGLSCSAKYNAAPICIVPLALWWFRDRSLSGFIVTSIAPIAGFLIGAPYSIIAFSEFWKGISYEAWHYGIAGHEGNSSERGWPQFLFYLRWLFSDGVGVLGATLGLVGLCVFSVVQRNACAVLFSFPLAYTVLMCMQKTHFTRNMLVIVPYVAIAAGLAITGILQAVRNRWLAWLIVSAAGVMCLIPLGTTTYHIVADSRNAQESRTEVVDWLTHERPIASDVAIAGTLQLPIHVFSLPGVDAFDARSSDVATLIQAGYDFFVVPTDMNHLDAELNELVQSIPGEPGPQRIPRNPAISIVHARAEALSRAARRAPSTMELFVQDGTLYPRCQPNPGEPYCWINARSSSVILPKLTTSAACEIMSPWANQVVRVTDSDGHLIASVTLKVAGEWESLPLPASAFSSGRPLTLTLSNVHSPASRNVNRDTRRLGIAVRARSVSVE